MTTVFEPTFFKGAWRKLGQAGFGCKAALGAAGARAHAMLHGVA